MKRIIGHCPVDSGQLVLVDPCYLSRWSDNEPFGHPVQEDLQTGLRFCTTVTAGEEKEKYMAQNHILPFGKFDEPIRLELTQDGGEEENPLFNIINFTLRGRAVFSVCKPDRYYPFYQPGLKPWYLVCYITTGKVKVVETFNTREEAVAFVPTLNVMQGLTANDLVQKGLWKELQKELLGSAFSYAGACHATTSFAQGGEIDGGPGVGKGVAFSTGWGDGNYPVYADYDKETGRIRSITVKFF